MKVTRTYQTADRRGVILEVGQTNRMNTPVRLWDGKRWIKHRIGINHATDSSRVAKLAHARQYGYEPRHMVVVGGRS